jgi:7-carboxy-7-deazaguanine synthase (Cx14CxxC type)
MRLILYGVEMGYAVKEIFYSLQGEGFHAGRATVFCRFAGCNLWSGLEKHRATAQCRFCDTDFVGTDGTFGKKYKSAQELADQLVALWPKETLESGIPYVVFTGGEPTLQLDEELIGACHRLGFEVGIETNGTRLVPIGVDWICVSPKPRSVLVQKTGDELKLIYPQVEEEMHPEALLRSGLEFVYWYLQPMAGDSEDENTRETVRYCQRNTKWRLSLQTHKILGVR